MRHSLLGMAGGVALTAVGAWAQTLSSQPLSNAAVRTVIAERVEQARQGTGMVVGLIGPDGRRVIAHGRAAKGEPRVVTGDTVFEIGSVTKVFTALLLSDAVVRREVSLDDAVAGLVPGWKVPEKGRPITLRDLAMHVSGLPRLPSNMAPKDPNNPYADYTVEQLRTFLATYELPRSVGERYEYSNLGGGLLGHVLARRAGTSYEDLVESTVTRPLGMASTHITLRPEMRERLAAGYSPTLEPATNWDLPTLAGAGALRSTVNDLLTFLSAALGYTPTPLARAFAQMTAAPRPTGAPNLDIALAWHVFTANGRVVYWHNGGTAGYRSFIGFDPARRMGVVVLSNSGSPVGVDDIGRHLLDPSAPLLDKDSPLLRPPVTRTALSLDSGALDRFVGQYQLAPQVAITVTRRDARLFVQLTGQPELEVFAEAPTRFFLKSVDAQITFEVGPQGRAAALVLHQNGRDQRAPRLP